MLATFIEQAGTARVLPDRTIALRARITDPAGIRAVRCYFRFGPESGFLFVHMRAAGDGLYEAIIPAPSESVRKVEYLFLVVNERRQAVRTSVHAIAADPPGQAAASSRVVAVYTDLPALPDAGGWFRRPELVSLQMTGDRERFGLAAGLYDAADFAGNEAVEGYYGGFLFQEAGRPLPVKGLMLPGSTTTGLTLDSFSTQGTGDAEEEPVYPDIAGRNWKGSCYLLGGTTGAIAFEQPVTATVTRDGDAVTLTTSVACSFYWDLVIIGDYFWGNMDTTGNLTLYDERIPVQTWTTHWGPVTETSIMIGDYVTPPSEEDPYGDFYVIELYRDSTVDPSTILPIIDYLLLHREIP